jgi:hypothetical protein
MAIRSPLIIAARCMTIITWVSDPDPPVPDTGLAGTYSLSFDTMSSGVAGSGSYQVVVKFTLTNGTTKSLTCKVSPYLTTWHKQPCVPITLTRAFKKIQITIQYTKPKGTVWFDDIRLVQN